MRRRVRGDYLHRVSAIRQQGSVKGIELVREIALEEQPAGLTLSPVIDRIGQLVVVLVAHCPLHTHRLALANRIRRTVEALRGFRSEWAGHRLVTHSGCDRDIIELWRDI